MYTFAPGKTREIWRPNRFPSHSSRTVSWRIYDPKGALVAETTTKSGAETLCGLLNAR